MVLFSDGKYDSGGRVEGKTDPGCNLIPLAL